MTVASTPGIRFSFFSIRAAQEEQVIPPTRSSTVWLLIGRPVAFGVEETDETLGTLTNNGDADLTLTVDTDAVLQLLRDVADEAVLRERHGRVDVVPQADLGPVGVP